MIVVVLTLGSNFEYITYNLDNAFAVRTTLQKLHDCYRLRP